MSTSRWKTLSVESLKELLGWSDVREEFDGLWRICAYPPHPRLAPVCIILSVDRDSPQAVGFAGWHYHPAQPEDEPEERDEFLDGPLDAFDSAIRVVRSLVRRKSCIVHQLDEAGKTLAYELCGVNEIPERLEKRVVSFRRILFDEEPALEEIDFTRYVSDGMGSCVIPELRRELERLKEIERRASRQDLTETERAHLYEELVKVSRGSWQSRVEE